MRALTFRRTPPREPGLYWYKLVGSDTIRVQWVFLVNQYGQLCIDNGEGPIDVRQPLRLWAGPIQQPEAPR